MIYRLATTTSTMRNATALADAGAPHMTAVVADEQTAGIGRHGHSWHSEPNAGLYVSVILRLPDPPPILTLALGLATVDAIRDATGLVCDIRWPNDVMAAGRKTAGIMVQMGENAAIAGIGINVNHSAFPPELAGQATSLRLQAKREFDREPLLESLLRCTADCCEIVRKNGNAELLRMFSLASSYASGKRVRVDLGDRTIEGVTIGLDDHGFLLVRKPDGAIETVYSGGVRPA